MLQTLDLVHTKKLQGTVQELTAISHEKSSNTG